MNWMKLYLFVFLWLFMAQNASADTYNFFFTKPKPKAGEAIEEPRAKEVEENESKNEKVSPPPAEAGENAKSSSQPIVIHNHNVIHGQPKQENEVAPKAISSKPSETPEKPVLSAESQMMVPSRVALSPWRFGVSGAFVPSKPIDDFFKGSDRDMFYGGSLSLAYVASSFLTLNSFAGAFTSRRSKIIYQLGLEAELSPFSTSTPPWEVNPLDLSFLVGGNTYLLSDGRLGSLHAGARLSLNFSPKIGITATSRLSTEGVMIEAGFVTRL